MSAFDLNTLRAKPVPAPPAMESSDDRDRRPDDDETISAEE